MYARKSASSLTAAEQNAFAAAVLVLKTRPSVLHPGDRDRGRYDDFVEIHRSAMAVMETSPPGQSWGHMAAAFAPWHRVLLHHFEAELQQIDPTVALPYWDWTAASGPNSPLWNPGFLGGDGDRDGVVTDGPFCRDRGQWPLRILDQPGDDPYLTRAMGRAQDARALPTAGMVTATLAQVPYDSAPWEDMMRDPRQPGQWRGFRYQLEAALHNLVHRWVGGTMVAMASPNDPVFWLHHANIDRLWSDWIRQHQGQSPYLPLTGGPAGHNLYDTLIFHAPGQPPPWPGDARPADVLDHHALGYRYDTDPPGEEKLPMGPVPAQAQLPAGPPTGPMPMAATAGGHPQRRSLPRFASPDDVAAAG